MAGLTLEQSKDIVGKWRASPVVRHYSFSDKKLWSKQEEILWALRNNKRVDVKSGNTVGKSFIAADVVMDWLLTHVPSKVVTTAPTFHQVETILWREIRQACFNSKIKLGVEPLQTELKFNDEWFALGISTDKPVNFQGKHSPNLLVILDEASGITPEIWDMVEALHPKGILAIGNPLDPSGKFYDAFQSSMWHKITIDCEECVKWQKENGAIPGLVTQEWIDDQLEMHGRGSAWYQVHVKGEFPMETEETLISRAWVERARKGLDLDNNQLDEELEEDSVRVMASDVATKHGDNLTVIGYRHGHTLNELKGYKKIDTTTIADKIGYEMMKKQVASVVIDSDGFGEGVADTLVPRGVFVLEFHGGSAFKAFDNGRYRNLRTQFYYLIAKKFEKGLYNLSKLPQEQYEVLKLQLCQIKKKPEDQLGRFQIETKEDLAGRGVKSPDFADTFMMLEYAYYMSRMADVKPYRY